MKKIVYIYLGIDLANNASGVQKKISSKIKAINEIDFFCQGISFSNNITTPLRINEYLTILPYKKESRSFLNSFYQQKLIYEAITIYLNANIKNYDYVLFRYPLASLSLLNLTKKFKNIIIFEHNTKEIEEIEHQAKLFRKSLKFSIKPGYFIYLLERGYLIALQEKFFGKRIFKYAKAGIAVTNEIAQYERKRQPKYKVDVVTNGIEVLNCSLREQILFDKKKLKLFMLLGSANKWNGVDRLLKSLEEYNGECCIEVDIIGAVHDEDKLLISESKANKHIKIVPALSASDLDFFLNQYHAGIGSLAVFRKGLVEATPLKTREYMARGFAVILGYTDIDLEHRNDFLPYYLKVNEDESPINFHDIVDYIHNLYMDTNHHIKIRNSALKYLDTKVKMRELVNIINN